VHVPASLQRTSCEDAKCALSWTAAVAGSLEIIAACLESASLL
jgi:hypothetical protein